MEIGSLCDHCNIMDGQLFWRSRMVSELSYHQIVWHKVWITITVYLQSIKWICVIQKGNTESFAKTKNKQIWLHINSFHV